MRFLRDHTGARRAHLVIDKDNAAARRVAAAVGAIAYDSIADERGRTLLRHRLEL